MMPVLLAGWPCVVEFERLTIQCSSSERMGASQLGAQAKAEKTHRPTGSPPLRRRHGH